MVVLFSLYFSPFTSILFPFGEIIVKMIGRFGKKLYLRAHFIVYMYA